MMMMRGRESDFDLRLVDRAGNETPVWTKAYEWYMMISRGIRNEEREGERAMSGRTEI